MSSSVYCAERHSTHLVISSRVFVSRCKSTTASGILSSAASGSRSGIDRNAFSIGAAKDPANLGNSDSRVHPQPAATAAKSAGEGVHSAPPRPFVCPRVSTRSSTANCKGMEARSKAGTRIMALTEIWQLTKSRSARYALSTTSESGLHATAESAIKQTRQGGGKG